MAPRGVFRVSATVKDGGSRRKARRADKDLEFCDFYEVMNGLHHAEDGGVVLFDYDVVELAETEGVESAFLHGRGADAAFDLLYLNFSHF